MARREPGALARCSSPACDAPIYWRRNIAGSPMKNVPLDAIPPTAEERLAASPKWHYVILDAETCRPCRPEEWGVRTTPVIGKDGKPTGDLVAIVDDPLPPVYTSHWRTCRNPDRFKRSKDMPA